MPQDILQRQQQEQQEQQEQHHDTTNSSIAATVEPRKKRAKIMSACGECRRKKTKCNGEQPCRNCQKANAACIYPIASQMDDKRNYGGPSKAALEAIEDRLKAIEDMLKTILQTQLPVHDLDPVAVNNFLAKSNDIGKNKNISNNNNNNNSNRLPSIHNLSAALPVDATTTVSYHHHNNMVSPSTPSVNHLPPPIGLMQNEDYHHHHQHQQRQRQLYQSQQQQLQDQQTSSQSIKKRKR